MKPLKYKEWKVSFDGKEMTKEKKVREVSIHEHEAELLNSHVKQTHKFYELVKEEKSEVRKQADELGIEYRDNISDAKLQAKIDTHLNS